MIGVTKSCHASPGVDFFAVDVSIYTHLYTVELTSGITAIPDNDGRKLPAINIGTGGESLLPYLFGYCESVTGLHLYLSALPSPLHLLLASISLVP